MGSSEAETRAEAAAVKVAGGLNRLRGGEPDGEADGRGGDGSGAGTGGGEWVGS